MEKRRIESIKVGSRFRRDLGDIAELAKSIAEIGLLHPIVIAPDGTLIAGLRRLEACKQLGWREIPVNIVDIANLVRGERDENVVRKDFLPSEAVAIARALEPAEREAARERREATQAKPGQKVGEHLGGGNLPPPTEVGKTRDKVARYVGMSGRTLEKAEEIVKAAERDPEKYAPLVEEMDKTRRVDGVYRKLIRMEQAEQIKREPPPLPTGPFRVIVADPPWPYEKRADDPSHRSALPYPAMGLDEIRRLPVSTLAHEDSVLWLWTTNAHLPVAFSVAEAWGFEYKTLLTWVKDRMGTGDWLRGQTEHCLLCVRGRPTVVLTNQTTVLFAPARDHSRKPDEFYAMVEEMCPGSKVELFARAKRPGWIAHGNEIQ